MKLSGIMLHDMLDMQALRCRCNLYESRVFCIWCRLAVQSTYMN